MATVKGVFRGALYYLPGNVVSSKAISTAINNCYILTTVSEDETAKGLHKEPVMAEKDERIKFLLKYSEKKRAIEENQKSISAGRTKSE